MTFARTTRKMKHLPTALELVMREALFEQAEAMVVKAVDEVDAPKHGKVYLKLRRSGPSGLKFIKWQASAPGEAPARKTGKRVAQISAKKSNRALRPQSRVKAPSIYRLLARGLGNIAPRPLFQPLFRREAPSIKRELQVVARRGLRAEVKKP